MNIHEIIRKNIKKLRTLKKYSQEKLALETGFERNYISQVENGHKNIGLDNIEKIAVALKVSIADFVIEIKDIPSQTFISEINGKAISIEGQVFDKNNVENLKNIYSLWRTYSSLLKASGDRQANVPAILSEGIVSYLYRNIRVDTITGAGATDLKTSMDNFNITTGERIQVKSTSIENDCTSFGPKTDYDILIFVDFLDEKVKIYDLSKYIDILKQTILNKKKNETFLMQQNAGKRPRLSIKSKLIKKHNISPLVEIYISKIEETPFII